MIMGSLPVCLLQLPHITTLHLSGNGLTGTIPNDVQFSPTLLDLSLSHSLFSGDLPHSVQTRHDLTKIMVNGVLVDSFATYNSSSVLRMTNNRFSGTIPGPLKSTLNISVLQGNLFSCSLDRSNLPKNDPCTVILCTFRT